MTEVEVEAVPVRRRVRAVVQRMPATLTIVALLLVVGVISRGLWTPFEDTAAWDVLAYGLPAFEGGRWWTPITGTFLINEPWVYAMTIASLWGLAFLEYRRGSRVATAYFVVGQLFAIFAAALVLWLLSFTPSEWAATYADVLDVGPSGGAFAGMAAAIALFRPPWRLRALTVLIAFVLVALLFWGSVADVEHALAVVLVLTVDRTLRVRRATVRELRMLAAVLLVSLLAVEILVALLPTDGVFGPTEPISGAFWDVATDGIVIAIVAHGLHRGRRWAWTIAMLLAALNIVTGFLILGLIALIGWDEVADILVGDPSVTLATTALWLGVVIFLAVSRRAFQARRRSTLGAHPVPTVAEVRDDIHRYGGGNISWMATWERNSYLRTRSGVIAFQRRAGVALVLGDPIGPDDALDDAVTEYIDVVEHHGLVPCFFSASERTRAAVPAGWRSLVVADDTIVDLPGLQYTGKRWNSVRTSLNRAGREEMTFRMTHLHDEPWGVQAQVRAISESWVADKGLPEMGFTLGSLTEADDPEVRVALAISPHGDVDGFLSWLPVYAPGSRIRGWTLDLMRRRDGGFGPVMEYLIGQSAIFFRDEGAEFMSLSGAPLAHDYPPDAGMIADLSERLAEALEPVYGFRSLHRFKDKFHPRYQTMYLLYRDEADLTRIAAALTRAFLPDSSLLQVAGAGLGLMRSGA